ncbi:MAG: glycosyltransferase [Clostridiales bacterium]|jgi:glycosyltransferase EpsJ|nr:glycosyltransferase [Clostridiales bacterium]
MWHIKMAYVSVIVPVYQAEKHIEKCVNSVLEQTFTDWELILVDDGSKDGSGAICDKFARSDTRIRVIHQENTGVSGARNAGIKASSSEYIAFLDSDDYYKPDMLDKLIGALKNSGADSAGCGHIYLYPDGRAVPEAPVLSAGVYGAEDIRKGLVRPLLRDRLEGEIINGYVVRFLYKSSIIKKNNIEFTGAYLEDELFLIEYFSLAGRLSTVDEPLYVYYINPHSVTRRYLKDYTSVFRHSLEMKKKLVDKYKISGIDGWIDHTCWAGLLIAVANEFAPGNPAGFLQKRKKLISLCREPLFADAIKNLKPENVRGNKRIVADLIRARQYTLLSILYTLKNRGRM